MRKIVLFISTLLTWVAFDYNLHRRRRSLIADDVIEITLFEEESQFQQQKKIQRHHLDVIPARLRHRKVRLYSKCSYKGTRSRDQRDSNQKAIRRKFNNM